MNNRYLQVLIIFSIFLFVPAESIASHFISCECKVEVLGVQRFDSAASKEILANKVDTRSYYRSWTSKEYLVKPIFIRFRVLEELARDSNNPYTSDIVAGGSVSDSKRCREYIGQEKEADFMVPYEEFLRIKKGDFLRLMWANSGDVYGSTHYWKYKGILKEN